MSSSDSSDDENLPLEPFSAESIKDSYTIIHHGNPSLTLSKFAKAAKKPKWPEDLWTNENIIYDVHNKGVCLPPVDPNASPPDNVLRFESHFESGNLSQAILLSPDTYHCICEYDHNASGSCQWFYFQIKNVRRIVKYTFFISGFHKKSSLYSSGSSIFWYSEQRARRENISWTRGGTNYSYQVTQRTKAKKKRASLHFQMKFPYDDDIIYFCYALPYTYSTLLRSISNWESHFPDLISHEILCQTVGGRDCPILTIYSKRSSTPPDKRPVFFVTARIHPGESNSSYLLHGLIDFLLSDTQYAHYILETCTVKIVPMLNIDGVMEGFYRISLSGNDLNRMWNSPDLVLHPEIYATKKLMTNLQETQGITFYIDFHGHSRLHGTFAYGCPNQDDPELRNTEKIFPRILAFLSDIFSWEHCVYSYPKERQSAGRIVARTELGIVNSFTVEASFGGVTSGPRAGFLYDETLWKELGSKAGEAVFHCLTKDNSPLAKYVIKELEFISPQPERPKMEEDVVCKFNEEEDNNNIGQKPRVGQIGLYHIRQPTMMLNIEPEALSTQSKEITSPHWIQMQYVL